MKTQPVMFAKMLPLALLVAAASCSSSPDSGGNGGGATGGSPSSSGTGGSKGSGGVSGSGGSTSASGGTSGGSGGSGAGGSAATGGSTGSGGSSETGGTSGATGGTSGGTGGAGPVDGGGTETAPTDTGGGTPGEFALTSPDFLMISNNRLCHKKESTGSGGQISPALNWTGLPADTKSIVVSLKDRDAGTHWVMWDIPPTVMGLPRDINAAMKPEGSKNSGAWYGPGAGLPYHNYEYRVWAMKVPMLPNGCAGKACYPNALMTNAIAFKELIVVGTRAGTCPQ
jgi:phosphatidylethanolamine-binding protein (PEBP) family uncharacterized protein